MSRFGVILCLNLETILDQMQVTDVIFGGTQVCVLLHFGPGAMRRRYHNNHRFIMRKDNVSKVTLLVQNYVGIIIYKFRAVQSKTEGMAASVRVFFEHPS